MLHSAARQLLLPNCRYILYGVLIARHAPSPSLALGSHEYCPELLPARNLRNWHTSGLAGEKGL